MTDPVTATIVAALATASATKLGEGLGESVVTTFRSLYRAVTKRFRSEPEAQEALDDLRLEQDDSKAVEAVSVHLERAAREDQEIGRLLAKLRADVGQIAQEGEGSVVNQIHGDVSGSARVIQGRDFHGGIHL
ncbi:MULTISPECIES: hypothetical protein [unclassified Nocardiopsis]|jgi:ADP-dependent phosphofructokinase/glucokinase|uniref:hypothetical protein n=1 Tax=unclassified Nocardiopsis TaxID=2649073 RepID=UPI00066E347B|nr:MULTISPECIES: hypothetical protein [unclassified Nocardiopsis]MBQ1084302.1 hypothetical protein [Nocardiopsis sp. B62]